MDIPVEELFYDWNATLEQKEPVNSGLIIHDESLRDGLQSASARDPSIEDKIRILHLLNRLGVQRVALGFPAASPRNYQHVLRLVQEIEREKLRIRPACSSRTVIDDILPILEISNKTSVPIDILTFIGSSQIRALVENWDRELLAERTEKAVSFAVNSGYRVTYITEDTTRSHPNILVKLFNVALDSGAGALWSIMFM
jgi:2-isopropylmalate synthase